MDRATQRSDPQHGIQTILADLDTSIGQIERDGRFVPLARELRSTVDEIKTHLSASLLSEGARPAALVISDDGIGFDKDRRRKAASVGVGIVGMEERVRELGGRFSIRRGAKGTVVSASLPRKKSDPVS